MNLNTLFNEVNTMSDAEKRKLRGLRDAQLAQEASGAQPTSHKAGWAKGLYTIGPEFDLPLEDFQDYIP